MAKKVKCSPSDLPVLPDADRAVLQRHEPFLTMDPFREAALVIMGYRPCRAAVLGWVRNHGLRATKIPGSPKLLFRISWFVAWLEGGPIGAATPQQVIDSAYRRRDLEASKGTVR